MAKNLLYYLFLIIKIIEGYEVCNYSIVCNNDKTNYYCLNKYKKILQVFMILY